MTLRRPGSSEKERFVIASARDRLGTARVVTAPTALPSLASGAAGVDPCSASVGSAGGLQGVGAEPPSAAGAARDCSKRALGANRLPLVLATLCAVAAALVFMPASSQATQIHRFLKSFPLPGSGTPLELAINQSSGEVYVSADNAGVVDAFEASGAPDATHPHLTQADGTTTYNFSLPYGVAVDNTVAGDNKGDVYVADYGAAAVVQFGPSGSRTATPAITATNVPAEGTAQSGGLPTVVNNRGLSPTGVTVAPNGDVYVSDQSNNVVDIFEPSGVFVAQIGAGNLGGPYGLALDPSGNLYVAEYGVGVIELDSTGACVNSCAPIGGGSLGVATDPEGNVYNDEINKVIEFNSSDEQIDGFGSFSFGRGIAINDSSGDIYVADEPAGQINVFEPITLPTVTTGSVTNPNPATSTVTLNGQVDPDAAHGGGEITECNLEYGKEEGNYSLGSAPCSPATPYSSPTAVSAEISGLSTATRYFYRLAAADTTGTNYGSPKTFILNPDLPEVDSTLASAITPDSATLSAQIKPGFGSTIFRFQYGSTTSYGEQTPPSESIGSDNTDHDASGEISGLTPGTTYHFRVIATNFSGSTVGPDQSLTTIDVPKFEAAPASNVTKTTATLNAEIDPALSPTTYHFEYGTNTSYGFSTPQSASLGSDNTFHLAGAVISGLTPNTTYHFRAVAVNAAGTSRETDQTFTTAPEDQTGSPPILKCHKGLVKIHGRCIKKSKSKHHKRKHHKHKRKHHKHGGKK